jgi:hypothetical protein
MQCCTTSRRLQARSMRFGKLFAKTWMREALTAVTDLSSRDASGGIRAHVCSVKGLRAGGIAWWFAIESGSVFSASHSSMSERSHPPEACFLGNRPFWIQRNSVERFTPTTRRTSAALILWSSAGILGRSDFPVTALRGFGFGGGACKRRESCCGHSSPIGLLRLGRTVSPRRV